MIPIYLNENERAEVDDIYETVLHLIECYRDVEDKFAELNNKIGNLHIKTNILNVVIAQERTRMDELFENFSNLKEENIRLQDRNNWLEKDIGHNKANISENKKSIKASHKRISSNHKLFNKFIKLNNETQRLTQLSLTKYGEKLDNLENKIDNLVLDFERLSIN